MVHLVLGVYFALLEKIEYMVLGFQNRKVIISVVITRKPKNNAEE